LRSIFSIVILFLFLFNTQFVFPTDEEWDSYKSREKKDTAKHALIAGWETLTSVGTLMIINKLVLRHAWAFPTPESIRDNFTVPWYWEDTDGFFVNQYGHAYQGSLSFSAGRVNGFNFYNSLIFSAFGSFIWETLGESQHASVNDMIYTVTGSIPLGEMFYRLYLEAYANGIPTPLLFFINPMAVFHKLVTGYQPPKAVGNIYQFYGFLSGGYGKTHFSISDNLLLDNSEEIFNFSGPYANFGFKAIYGNPFEQDTNIPYRHFEFDFSIGTNFFNYVDINIISDGYLYSFSPVNTEINNLSTGLSMQFDVIARGRLNLYDSTVDMLNSGLDWTVKYRHLFSGNTNIQIKSHAGLTYFAVSEFYSPEVIVNEYKPMAKKNDLKNYGFGFNTKHFFIIERVKKNRLELSSFFYLFFPYPGTSALSGGTSLWLFADISYSHFITKKISLCVTNSYVMERGYFKNYPGTKKYNNAVKLFVAWNL
jgi:hypothetical protein